MAQTQAHTQTNAKIQIQIKSKNKIENKNKTPGIAPNIASDVGLAMFAKTAELSPVKTRLAAHTSTEFARVFYTLSTNCTANLAQLMQNQLTPYWALAEHSALTLPQWQTQSRLWTGEGALGARLHNIYHALQKRHGCAILIGTDSPQLTPANLKQAMDALKRLPNSCVIGPCADGGFYLFGGAIEIPRAVWTNVVYSQPTTLQALSLELTKQRINIHLLPVQTDVDRLADLAPLTRALEANAALSDAQKTLLEWLHNSAEVF